MNTSNPTDEKWRHTIWNKQFERATMICSPKIDRVVNIARYTKIVPWKPGPRNMRRWDAPVQLDDLEDDATIKALVCKSFDVLDSVREQDFVRTILTILTITDPKSWTVGRRPSLVKKVVVVVIHCDLTSRVATQETKSVAITRRPPCPRCIRDGEMRYYWPVSWLSLSPSDVFSLFLLSTGFCWCPRRRILVIARSLREQPLFPFCSDKSVSQRALT